MNFGTVRNANGQLIEMFATALEVGPSKLSSNKKPYQAVKLRDDTGEEHQLTIMQGQGKLLDAACLNQRLAFNLETYQGRSGVAYSGFWRDTVKVNQAPAQYQQGPPQIGQAEVPPKEEVDWDAKDLRNAKMNGLNNATSFLIALATITSSAEFLQEEKAKSLAKSFVDWIYEKDNEPEESSDEPPF